MKDRQICALFSSNQSGKKKLWNTRYNFRQKISSNPWGIIRVEKLVKAIGRSQNINMPRVLKYHCELCSRKFNDMERHMRFHRVDMESQEKKDFFVANWITEITKNDATAK